MKQKGMFNSGVEILSKGWVVRILLCITIICRMQNALFNQDFNSDKEAQIIAGQSFVNGNGMALPNAKSTDISQLEYKEYYQWPRGYSAYFAFVYFIVGNVFWAAFIVDALAILLYCVSWLWLIKIFSKDGTGGNLAMSIFLLLTAFSNVPFDYLKSSDLIAISFYMFALCGLFSGEGSRKGWLVYAAGLIAICLAIYSRYAYIPVAFCLLLGFFLLYFRNRKSYFIKRFLIGVAVVALFVVLTNHSSESPAFKNEAIQAGYNFHTLSKFYFMFPVQSIVSGNTVHSVTKIMGGHVKQIFSALLCLVFLAMFIWSMWKITASYFSVNNISRSPVIILSSFAAGLIAILLLVYMSLTRPIQKNDILDNWTYVEEKRYYVIVWVTMLMSFLYSVMHGRALLKQVVLTILLISITIEVPYFFYNTYVLIKKNNTFFQTGISKLYFLQFPKDIEERDAIARDYEHLHSMIISSTKKNGIRPVYMSADRSERVAVIQGAVFGAHELTDQPIKTSVNQDIIIKIAGDDPYANENLKSFVERNKISKCYSGRIGDLYFCTVNANGIFDACAR